MKAEIIETKKAFEPIEIKLVIESLNTGTDDGGFWKSLWYKAENLNLITS